MEQRGTHLTIYVEKLVIDTIAHPHIVTYLKNIYKYTINDLIIADDYMGKKALLLAHRNIHVMNNLTITAREMPSCGGLASRSASSETYKAYMPHAIPCICFYTI